MDGVSCWARCAVLCSLTRTFCLLFVISILIWVKCLSQRQYDSQYGVLVKTRQRMSAWLFWELRRRITFHNFRWQTPSIKMMNVVTFWRWSNWGLHLYLFNSPCAVLVAWKQGSTPPIVYIRYSRKHKKTPWAVKRIPRQTVLLLVLFRDMCLSVGLEESETAVGGLWRMTVATCACYWSLILLHDNREEGVAGLSGP